MIRSFFPQRLLASLNNWVFTNSRLVIRILVMSAVLVGSMVLAPRAAMGGRIYMMLFLLLLGIGPALLILYIPVVGLLLLIPAGLIMPFNIGMGSGTSLSAPVLLIVLIFGLWLLDMLVRQKKISFVSSRPFLPLSILLVVVTLAFGVGQLPWFLYARQASIAAQIGGLAIFFLSATAFSLAANHISNLRWLQYLTWIFLISGSIYLLGLYIPSSGIVRYFQRGANGSLFWCWMVALSFSQALFNTTLKTHWRLALACLAAATLAVVWLQVRNWASGWVPGVMVVGILFWLRSWRLGFLVSVIGLVFLLVFEPGLITQLWAADDYSISTRELAWEIVLRDIFSVNPVLGLGPANYYHYTSLFPILGWYVAFNSHNQYVDLLAQTGILGLLAFLWFAWEVWRLGWRLRSTVPEGFARAYVNGALAGLVGMLVAGMLGDWILPFVYNIGLVGFRASMLGWLFLGALVAVEQIYRVPNREFPSPAENSESFYANMEE